MMHRDDDTRPLRPATYLRRLSAPEYKIVMGVAKSLWINDVGLVAVNVIAEGDSEPEQIKIFGPGLVPVRVKAIVADGTTALDIIALYG